MLDGTETQPNATARSEGKDKVATPHAVCVDDVLVALDASPKGLDKQEVERRRQRYGRNELPQPRPTPAWRRLLRQFHNPLIYVLWISAVVSALLGHYVDCGVILAVIIINGLVGFVQEGRAEQALLSILAMSKTETRVLRNGRPITLDSAELVPGDIVLLEAGDRVPADMRLLESRELRCDESALTGESMPVDKYPRALPADTILAERSNMVFMGTLVRVGSARGVVTHTGLNTELGGVSSLVREVELEKTPLQRQLARLARQLTIFIIVLTLTTTVYGIWVQDFAIGTMFQSAIGIAVAAIPEGLPAVVTIALAIGVQRMARHRALVRQLPAVEVLGSVDVICTDKTGTLTTNIMTVREVVTGRSKYIVSGEGYSSDGDIEHDGGERDHREDDDLAMASRIAMLCNDADVTYADEQWQLSGDPTEGALLGFAMKTGLDRSQEDEAWPRHDAIPFASERRYMATLHRRPEEKVFILVKGAPDRLLEQCDYQLVDGTRAELDANYWHDKMTELARGGMRVLALAYRELSQAPHDLEPAHAEDQLTMVALVGIADPPRPEAVDAIAQCHNAGIRVKMITGDNADTAAAIGRELGLNTAEVLTGRQLEQMNAEQLGDATERVDIYARTSPANKLQLVEALQRKQHVVAMTGDGVNDAPALKKSNIGVAMGKKGSDAAKEAAHFILTDDNFATIVRAVREGRTVYDNIVKTILYVLPVSLAQASVIVTAVLLGLVLPLTPVQVLWVNLITAVTLCIALAFELGEANIMQRPPRPIGQALITVAFARRLLLIVAWFTAVIFWLFHSYLDSGHSLEYARTVAVNALVLFEIFYLFNGRFLYEFAFSRAAFRHSKPAWISVGIMVALQLGFTYLPISQQLFGLESVLWHDWLWLIAVTAPIMIVVELEKMLAARLAKTRLS